MPNPRQLALSPDRKPWERQEGETNLAWRLFLAYLNPDGTARQRHQRSVKKTSEIEQVSALTVYNYSSAGLWRERCRAYDDQANRDWLDNLASERARVARTMVEELDGLLANLARFRELMAANPDLLPADYSKHLTTASTVFRTVLGPAPETVHHTGPDGGALEIDWAALDKASPEELAAIMNQCRETDGTT